LRYHRLGDSPLEVSEVCLGTMTFGQQNSEREGHEQLDLALAHGVTFIDTAEMYPVPGRPETQGATESIIGSWFARSGQRERVVLATKVIGNSGLSWIRDGGKHDRQHIRQALEGSLRRLRTDYVDLYQLHWPDRYVPKFGGLHFEPAEYRAGVPIEETLAALAELVDEGKIRAYGLSNETPWGISQFVRAAERNGWARPAAIQNAYHLLNRVFDIHLAESCFHENIPLLAYSPLAFGWLTGKYRGGARPAGARLTLFPEFPQRYREKINAEPAIEAYARLAGDFGLGRMALTFVKSRTLCKSVIIGATSLAQLRENLAALEDDLPAHLAAEIEHIHRRYPNPCP